MGLIQFMLVLDLTVVNVALPRIQNDLGFSTAGLVWVVNGYALMAGGLLLGGRLADVLGRRRLFLVGVGVKALGIWGGLTGLGGVSGTVISGALTDLASWRWIFFANLPIALIAL